MTLPATPAVIAGPMITQYKRTTQTIEGVLVEGTRITSKFSDPRSGVRTQKRTNVAQGEPAAELFAPPPDYSVVDESGPFTLRWGSPR